MNRQQLDDWKWSSQEAEKTRQRRSQSLDVLFRAWLHEGLPLIKRYLDGLYTHQYQNWYGAEARQTHTKRDQAPFYKLRADPLASTEYALQTPSSSPPERGLADKLIVLGVSADPEPVDTTIHVNP